MYAAKESGKHRFAHYDPSMHAKVKLRHEFALGLRKALERNEIGVVFEPIVDLRHGKIVAFEALARWHSPERGVVMPGEFLPGRRGDRRHERRSGSGCCRLACARPARGRRPTRASATSASR